MKRRPKPTKAASHHAHEPGAWLPKQAPRPWRAGRPTLPTLCRYDRNQED